MLASRLYRADAASFLDDIQIRCQAFTGRTPLAQDEVAPMLIKGKSIYLQGSELVSEQP